MNFGTILRSILGELQVTLGYLLPGTPRQKLIVEQYPDLISGRSVADMFPKFKGYLQNDLDRCTGCGECIEVCPVKALQMDSKVERDGSVAVENFRIDLGRCFSCGACVEICAPVSLGFSKQYEIAAEKQEDLVAVFRAQKKVGPAQLSRIRSYEVRR